MKETYWLNPSNQTHKQAKPLLPQNLIGTYLTKEC